jgi:hypothetical protein
MRLSHLLFSATCAFTLAFGAAISAHAADEVAAKPASVKVERPQSFQGITKVVIGQFSVAFFTKKIDYDGGGFLAVSNEGKAIGELSGVGPEEFQAATDAIYADFAAQMAAGGIAIEDRAGLMANPYYAKVKPYPQGSKVFTMLKKKDKADAVAYGPTALGAPANALLQSGMFDFGMGGLNTAEYVYAKESGIPVLNVVYFVDFAGPAKSSAGGIFQSLKITAELAVSPFGSRINLVDPNGKQGNLLLTSPISEGGEFATVTDRTSGLAKGLRTATIVGGAFFGGFGAGTLSKRFDFTVNDPTGFKNSAIAAGVRANTAFIGQMAARKAGI